MKTALGILIIVTFFTSLQAQSSENVGALIDSVRITRMQRDIDSLSWAGGYQSRVTYTQGNYLAAEYIARSFSSISGITSVQLDTFYFIAATHPYNNYPLYNVVATLPGSTEEEIIIGGHYDASCSREGSQIWNSNWSTLKAQGADDNASGVAAVLEIARLLGDPLNAYLNTYTIKFIAFAAEETSPVTNDSHLGSMHDAFKKKQSATPVKAVLVMDMIAYNTIMDYIEIISNTESVWLADSVHQWAQQYVPMLTVNNYPYPDVPYSDHDSYQIYGFPAILLMENDSPWNSDLPYYSANPNYHTQKDTYGTLNFSLLRKTTQLALATAILLDQTPTSINSPFYAESDKIKSDIKLSVFPNPFNGRTTLHCLLPRNGIVVFDIYNTAGQKVLQIIGDKFMNSGDHTFTVDLSSLATGIYFGVIKSTGSMNTVKFILIQ